ncbi:MAG: DEAD/DEAH box helicase [Syntrophales bacterium]|nr:DEAD/DEAH box helicase [Syntrophales bacterium]
MTPGAEPVLRGVFSRIGRPPEEPFIPDAFQLEALEAVRRADCLVTAPTGAGKTWIAEKAISAVFERGGRCWYASPLKALSNAKWVEFGASFGPRNVGILTGDTKENVDAPVIVGTTEILRNQLYDSMHRGESLDCDLIILDEAHFLGDEDRGVVWEEIMIYLPGRINLLLLSATIGNADEIARWLASIRGKECVVVREENRPVPLYPLFLHPSGRLMPLVAKKKLYGKIEGFLKDQAGGAGRRRQTPPYGDIIEVLREYDLLPAIFFLKSRSDCDAALKACNNGCERPDGFDFDRDISGLLERFPYLSNHKQLFPLRRARVASHHGGHLPAWKFMVESMMKSGRLDAIFATSTVAAGVNFPARTIVLFNSDQFNGREFLPLNATEFHQMTGRSGRRGLDRIGFMLAIPGPFMDLKHVRGLLSERSDDVLSRIRNDFSMVLNLLLSHSPEDVRVIFERSFASFQSQENGNGSRGESAQRLWKDFQKHLFFLKAEGFVNAQGRLTEDGAWASRLRLDNPLQVAECLRRGAFPESDEALLAAVVALFVYDGDDDAAPSKREIPRRLRRAYERTLATLRPLLERMDDAGFDTGPLPLWAAMAIYFWSRGMEWERLIEKTGMADGDLVMLISRTADNLRQIASLSDAHPEIAKLAARARETILREPVVFT